MFYDLNLRSNDPEVPGSEKTLQELLNISAAVSFHTVAINYVSTNGQIPQLPPLPDVSFPFISAPLRTTSEGGSIRVLRRITVPLVDKGQVRMFTRSNPHLRPYHVVAVRPSNEGLFQEACASLDIDLISLDITQRLPFPLRRKTINTALRRGIQFEISIAGLLQGPTFLRQSISNGVAIVKATKGKGIVLTSAASSPCETRPPASIFGLNHAQAKAALSSNCRAILLHGETRCRTLLGVIQSQPLPAEEGLEGWKLNTKEAAVLHPQFPGFSPHQVDDTNDKKRKREDG